MTIKQAIDGSIEKWEKICFRGKEGNKCALCAASDADLMCRDCPLYLALGEACDKHDHEGEAIGIWHETSDCNSEVGKKDKGCDGDYHMLLTLYMLKVISPNFEEED